MALDSVRRLFVHLIDYAGLFPPAGLEMAAAAAEYERYRQARESWMLGRFIVPVSRLDELDEVARKFYPTGPGGRPWQLGVLVGEDDILAVRGRIDQFNRLHQRGSSAGWAVIEQVELKPADAGEVAHASRAFEGLRVFFELAHDRDPGPLMAAVAACGGSAKIRSGGVTEEEFPTTEELARFISAAGRTGISFKATAGLHHPLRGEYPLTYESGAPEGVMHGFLNVFLAAALVKAVSLEEDDVAQFLERRNLDGIRFEEEEIFCDDYAMGLDAISRIRQRFALSYGSCSFAEPVADLKKLKLL